MTDNVTSDTGTALPKIEAHVMIHFDVARRFTGVTVRTGQFGSINLITQSVIQEVERQIRIKLDPYTRPGMGSDPKGGGSNGVKMPLPEAKVLAA